MADTAAIPEINTFLTERRVNIVNNILAGVTTGADLADFERLRQTLAAVPEFDDEGPSRWFYQDNIDTDLKSEPEDLKPEDIAHIRNTLNDIIGSLSESVDRTELTAHLYLLSLDRKFELPDGKTAVEFIEENPAITLKGDLRWLGTPKPDEVSAFGSDFTPYVIDVDKLTDPSSPDFIEAFGAALTAIQTDMRNIGIKPPEGADAFLDPQKLADPAQSALPRQVVEAIINKLGGDSVDALKEIKALEGTERLTALTTFVTNLDDANADKAPILEDLAKLSSPATPMEFIDVAIKYDVFPADHLPKVILSNIHDIGADKTGMFDENTTELLQAYLDYAQKSTEFKRTHGDYKQRADYFARLHETYLQLPEDQREAIDRALERNAGDAPGVQLPMTPEEEAEKNARDAAREEFKEQLSVLETAAEVMGIPADIIAEIDPKVLSGVTYAHFDEGYQRQMREIFSENWLDTYGIKKPAADDPSERIDADESMWRYRYPEPQCETFINQFLNTHQSNLIVQNVIGQTEDPIERFELIKESVSMLDEDDPLAKGFAELERDVNANSLEYHIHPQTGEISTYRVAANGIDLYSNAGPGDSTPLVLEGQKPNFDIFHPNFVTRDLLIAMSEDLWKKMEPDDGRGLGQIFTRQPNAQEIKIGIERTEIKAKMAIQALHPDMDAAGVDELFETVSDAYANPEEYYRQKLRRENPDIEDGELDNRLKDIMAGFDERAMLNEILRAKQGSDDSIKQIETYIIQIQSMRELGELTSMRDYTNLMVDGRLPSGAKTTAPSRDVPWGKDFSESYKNGAFDWNDCQEFRIFTPELYSAYNSALNGGGTVDISLFEHDEYAMSYIKAQGWEGGLDYVQTSMVARAMMIKEAADRHGVDPNSPEARAAFLDDYYMYNKIDKEIMMRSFDADGVGRAAERAEYNSVHYRNGSFDSAADKNNRMNGFDAYFKRPVEIPGGTNPDGTPMTAMSTITVDDAMKLYWRRNDPTKYGISYETMLEQDPENFPGIIKGIMEDANLVRMNLKRDVNFEAGDFHAREVRLFQASYNQRLETQYKEENNVVSPAPEVNVGATAELDPEADTITAMPEPETPTEPDAADNDNAAELRAMCDELTMPSAALAEACKIDPAKIIAPSLPGTP